MSASGVDRLVVTCPKCGKTGKLPLGMATYPKKVKCSGCQMKFKPDSEVYDLEQAPFQPLNWAPPPPLPMATRSAPESVSVSTSKPWYKDPILQFAVIFPVVAAIGLGAYHLREQAKIRFREDVIHQKAHADETQTKGKLLDAYHQYADLAEKSQGSSDEKVVEIFSQAEAERDKLFPKVKVQLDREETDRKRKAAEARWLAERKSKEAAAAKLRAEEGQRYQSEQTRLAQFTANLRGGAWVIKGAGHSDILRGMSVYVIRRGILKRNLGKVLSSLTPDQRKEAYIQSLLRQSDDTVVDLKQLHEAFRPVERFNAVRMIQLKYDVLWSCVIREALVAETVTNIDGKYEIKSLKGGHYLLCAKDVTNFGAVEWLIELNIEESAEVNQDLFNKTALEIVNKDD